MDKIKLAKESARQSGMNQTSKCLSLDSKGWLTMIMHLNFDPVFSQRPYGIYGQNCQQKLITVSIHKWKQKNKTNVNLI